jgi:hypothetical protein
MDPDALEDACRPVTRRTLYRRLRILQDEGLVGRLVTHEVPRRTHYAIQDRWRPVAGVLLLSAWWELRHGAQETQTFDLALLVHLVVPVAKVARAQSGSVTATVINGAEQASVRIEVRDGHLHTSALSGSADAEAVGSALAWATALVTDDRAALTITGSADLATAVIASVRAALLAYVR